MDIATIDKKWKAWVRGKGHIRQKLYRTYKRKSDRFLTTHAASEAALRRVLFVGLRMNKVTYRLADEWIRGHHITFGKKYGSGKFVTFFDRLFMEDWETLLDSTEDLRDLWFLWNDYAKPIRNHLAHALRKYSDEWLDTALATDRLFMMQLDKAIKPVIGGTPFAHLKYLSPRLSRGDISVTPEKVLNIKKNPPRPIISLTDAKARLGRL